jgi:hypothetical protein
MGLYRGGTPGFGMHGDAPCLKLGPHRTVYDENFTGGQLGVEPIRAAAADKRHVMSSKFRSEDSLPEPQLLRSSSMSG